MIIEKPWGKEEILENNENYTVKRLTMLKNCKCSLQYHNLKKETIYVLKGELKIIIDKTFKILKENEFLTIEPKTTHRMEGITECIYLESSTSQLDDVVRIEDDYNRI